MAGSAGLGLRDVSSIFSRYFIIGFFLPPFFGLLLLWKTLSGPFPPNRLEYGEAADVAIIGGGALLVGLLLIAYRQPISTILEGYPGRLLEPPLRRLLGWWESRMRKRYVKLMNDRQAAEAEITALDETLALLDQGSPFAEQFARLRMQAQENRSDVVRILDRYFPHDGSVRPTRFGNTMRASRSYALSRWGLDSYAVWPRIELMLNEAERERHLDEKTDLAFFINSALMAVVVALAYVVDWVAYRPVQDWWRALPVAAAVLVAYTFYRSAAGVVPRWGDEVRASIDLHRYELYRVLGLREPLRHGDDLEVADAINDALLRATPFPDRLRGSAAQQTPRDPSQIPEDSF